MQYCTLPNHFVQTDNDRDGKEYCICNVILGRTYFGWHYFILLVCVCVFVSVVPGGYGSASFPALPIWAGLPELHSCTDLQAVSASPQQWQGVWTNNMVLTVKNICKMEQPKQSNVQTALQRVFGLCVKRAEWLERFRGGLERFITLSCTRYDQIIIMNKS